MQKKYFFQWLLKTIGINMQLSLKNKHYWKKDERYYKLTNCYRIMEILYIQIQTINRLECFVVVYFWLMLCVCLYFKYKIIKYKQSMFISEKNLYSEFYNFQLSNIKLSSQNLGVKIYAELVLILDVLDMLL